MIDFVIIGIVALLAGAAIWHIRKQKKQGGGCGCGCSGCSMSGLCHSASSKEKRN